jgi:hypothetical protein
MYQHHRWTHYSRRCPHPSSPAVRLLSTPSVLDATGHGVDSAARREMVRDNSVSSPYIMLGNQPGKQAKTSDGTMRYMTCIFGKPLFSQSQKEEGGGGGRRARKRSSCLRNVSRGKQSRPTVQTRLKKKGQLGRHIVPRSRVSQIHQDIVAAQPFPLFLLLSQKFGVGEGEGRSEPGFTTIISQSGNEQATNSLELLLSICRVLPESYFPKLL